METRHIEYSDDSQVYEGYLATPGEGASGLIIVGHAWGGLGDHEREVAEKLATAGYAAFAYDLYGKGRRGETTEECQALMEPLASDRALLQSRLAHVIKTAQATTGTDASRTAVIGYCFGGLCALDCARAGLPVAGVVSLHGLFGAPDNLPEDRLISARVLALHGYDDPMATPEDMRTFCDEMTRAGADWQLHAFGGTMHAFTNKGANNPDFGTVYSASADARSWQAMRAFIQEL